MKKILIFLFLILCSIPLFARLYCPPNEWAIDGPGGSYGVVSCHTFWSTVLLGPISFTTDFDFRTTKLLYFQIPGILIAAVIVFLLMYYQKNQSPLYSKDKTSQHSWLRRNFNYVLLWLVVICCIAYFAWYPDYRVWRQDKINEKLCTAILANDLEYIKENLSAKNINIELIRIENGERHCYHTPLILATMKGNFKLVKFFLSRGSDIKFKTQTCGESVLQFAIFPPHDKLRITKYLIKNGADINALNIWQRSPLFTAVENNVDFNIIKLLVDSGGNVNLLDNGSRSVLDVAENDEVKKLLRAYGAKTSKEIKKDSSRIKAKEENR